MNYMKLTPVIEKAIGMSARLHRHQERRDSETPYAMHPYAVAFLISEYTDDEETIAAALMHDVLEDVRGYEYEDLVNDFGKRIASIVLEVSEERSPYFSMKKDRQTWRYRKERYLENLKSASKEALLVAAGDKYHNLFALVRAYREHGEDLWKKFHAPEPKKESILWFYKTAIEILDHRLDSPIVKEMKKLYTKAERVFK